MDEKLFKYRVAVATSDGIVVNQHFGRAAKFSIYEIGHDNTIHIFEDRNTVPICQKGNHDDSQLKESVKKLSDCKYVLISKIGQSAANALEQEGITPMELPGMIEESIQKLVVYEEIQSLLL